MPAINDIRCPLCGQTYPEAAGRSCRTSGCPLTRTCQLLRCPSCGYEVPAPGRLTRLMTRWLGRDAAAH